MTKKRRRSRQPATRGGATPPASSAAGSLARATARGRRADSTHSLTEDAIGFAEDLGRLLGTTQKKAEEWLGQRTALAKRLTQIRDAANTYLTQLTGAAAARAVTRGSVARRTDGSSASTVRTRKRRRMTAAQRKAVGERMRKYWAERRKTTAKQR